VKIVIAGAGAIGGYIGARLARAGADFGSDTIVVSTQNGIPWWYFQNHGGELEGLRLERVDPGGVIASSIEPGRVVGSLAYFATDISEPGVIHHTEGNRISFGERTGRNQRG